MHPDDEVPPSLNLCLERAGFESEVQHTALEDALDVVKVVRAGMDRVSQLDWLDGDPPPT